MIRNYKITKRVWAAALALMLIAPSCDLEIDETDSLLTKGESAVFNGIKNPGASLDQIYNDISGQAGDQANLYALTEVTTDELMVPTRGTDWGDNGVWRTLHQHTWSPTHAHILQVWNDKNGAVLRASQILDPLTTSATTEQKGQAKFARAYNMWIVMDFWGQVPFRQPADAPDVIPSVMSRSEAYDMIVKDLTEAITDLGASNPTASDKFRPVKAAARFLLAKVKLNANIYKGSYGSSDLQDVIDLVDQIQAEGYAVSSDYFETFHGPNYSNTDVIWAVNAGAGNRMWDGLHYNQARPDNTGGGWNGFTTLAEFYDKFEGPAETNALGSGQEERRGFTQTPESTNKDNAGFGFGFQFGQMYGWRYLDKDGNDSPAPVETPESTEQNRIYYDAVGHLVTLTTRTGEPLVFTKDLPGLIGNNEVTGIRLLKYSPANGAFTSGVVMARFADALLMRAEAKLRKGDAGGALIDVNNLRASRDNTPPLGSVNESTLLDERARELYTEGWRRNDLIRFGQFKGSWEFKDGESTADGHTDLFPIPPSALLSNPGLVQNPGY
jgi:starch-binding outer membrane protein, SusD/RagB family